MCLKKDLSSAVIVGGSVYYVRCIICDGCKKEDIESI